MRLRRRHLVLSLVLSLVAARAQAQDAPEQALPQGHPPLPTTVSPEETSPEATSGNDEERAGATGELPPGHPPIDQASSSLGTDTDSATTDSALPAATVVVEALDPQGRSMPGLQVELEIMQESVREGSSRIVQVAPTREDGRARFERLPSDSAHSFRARISRDSATFVSPAFTLGQSAGTRVRLHVYPVTRDVGAARVGSVAKVYVLPQEEAFLVEAMFSIANVGAVAWVVSNTRIRLPTGAEAFHTREATDALTVVRDGQDAARLQGTVGPGLRSVVFAFQVPRHGGSEQELTLGMPPRLMQATVMAESVPGMTLVVQGFPTATAQRGDNGRRVLTTEARVGGSAESLPKTLQISLGGLPTAGPGRWVALLASLGLLVGGVIVRKRTAEATTAAAVRGLHAEEVEAARSLILNELGDLERAHHTGHVGPRTYQQARRELVDALARLEPVSADAGRPE